MHALYLGLGFEFTGGIATLAKSTVGILARAVAAGEFAGVDRLIVITLHGTDGQLDRAQAGAAVEIRGCGGSRLKMARMVAPLARADCALLICEHVNLMPLIAALARRDLPCLCFIYSLEVWNGLSLVRRRALRRANCLLALAQASKRRTQTLFPELSRIVVCHPGVADIPARPPADDGDTILNVGRIVRAEPYKGQALLIEAMPELLKKRPSARLAIVGDGDGRPELVALADRLGVGGAVTLTGEIDGAQLANWYRRAAVFAMPARLEGFGLVYAEAMAHGLPVVAANCDASPEIIEDGSSGFLIRPGDRHELAWRLGILLDQPQLRIAMGRAGRARFERLFTLSAFERRLRGLLAELAAPAASRREVVS